MHFIDKCIETFLNKKVNPIITAGDEKRELNTSLPFMGKYSNEIKKKISRLSSKFLIKTKLISPGILPGNYVLFLRFTCNGCNSIYIGKTKRHFLVRAFEHLGVSLRTGKKSTYNPKNNNNSTILDHLHQAKECNGELNDFEIIGKLTTTFAYALKNRYLYKGLNLHLT